LGLRSAIVSQFQHPRGLLGRIVGWILAGRGSNLARNRWTVDRLDPTSGDRVLEIGCGPGIALGLLLSRARVTAVGVDHSKLMIANAGRRNAKAVKAGRLKLIVGTIDDIPADQAPFNKAFSINVIQFVDQEAFAARIHGLLKPGGTLATTYQPRHAKATRADALKMAEKLTALLDRAGFENLRTEELDLMPIPAVCVVGQKRPA
jgi:cyclopropane fatty-acyl-phospholipid synthase-like methyltransferase